MSRVNRRNPTNARKQRSSITALLFLVMFSAFCLALLLAGYTVVNLPRLASETFGPPAAGLDLLQRTRLSATLLLKSDELTKPQDARGGLYTFNVDIGETPPSVASRLQAAGIIGDPGALLAFLQYSGLDTTLQAGKYNLSPAMTPIEIAQVLQDPTPTEVTLTIFKGWRLEEIAATLPTSGLNISPDEFLEAAHARPDGYKFLKGVPEDASLEGFLFPGSYRVPRDISAQDLIRLLLDRFGENLTGEMLGGFERQGLSVYQGVTLASIVEREAVDESETPLIASVFLNRLGIGSNLDADSTVQFALGYNQDQETWWTNPLSRKDLQIDAPYNTYLYPGLPPGPIANPGLDALRAVAFPAQTPYYYFRAACDGSGKHVFAETYEEHVKNECP